MIAVGGCAGSGKSYFADQLVRMLGRPSLVVRLDDHYFTDGVRGVYAESGDPGRRFLDFNHPDSLDTEAVVQKIEEAAQSIIIVEGLFALADQRLRELSDLSVYVETPPDIRIGRKIARKYEERGQAPRETLRRYEESVRERQTRFVEPSKQFADVVLDGWAMAAEQIDEICGQIIRATQRDAR